MEGALYSTYTLWNLVNGDIRQVLRKYTLCHFNQRFLDQLINSDNPMTVLTGLKSFQKEDYSGNFQLIVTVMKRGNAMVNFYIAKNIPEEMLDSDQYKEAFLAIWDYLDPNTKFVLNKKFN